MRTKTVLIKLWNLGDESIAFFVGNKKDLILRMMYYYFIKRRCNDEEVEFNPVRHDRSR